MALFQATLKVTSRSMMEVTVMWFLQTVDSSKQTMNLQPLHTLAKAYTVALIWAVTRMVFCFGSIRILRLSPKTLSLWRPA